MRSFLPRKRRWPRKRPRLRLVEELRREVIEAVCVGSWTGL